MAGSFGYGRDHFEVSQTIAERRLIPAARQIASDENSVLVAAGVSCRHQIRDFGHTRAFHPAELLQRLVLDEKIDSPG